MLLSPATCFILDDGAGRAVGYIIGTPSTTQFIEKWKKDFIPTVDDQIVPKPDASTEDELMNRDNVKDLRKSVYSGECSMLQSSPDLLEKYPAHLHVDILPEFQNKGHGKKLIDTFLHNIQELEAGGVHLGMLASNENARRFYERLGFQLCDAVLDDGDSGEVGRHGHAICLVKRL